MGWEKGRRGSGLSKGASGISRVRNKVVMRSWKQSWGEEGGRKLLCEGCVMKKGRRKEEEVVVTRAFAL